MTDSNRLVLVVDDEPDIRFIVASSLLAEGFEVLEAENGADGLQMIRANPKIDLLFTDIVMPGSLDGFSLAHEAKKLRPDLRVLYTSGYVRNLPWGSSGIGYGRMLAKPFRNEELLREVRAALQ